MKFFTRKPKVTYEEFQKLERKLREVRHLVYPSEGYGWITFSVLGGKKPDPTKFEMIDEKLDLLAKELGLEFNKVEDNYSLNKPEPKEKK